MKLTILVATMNDNITQLLDRVQKLPTYIDIIICHQITNKTLNYHELKIDSEHIPSNIHIIQKYEKGLSKSRNCAINNVKKGICLISDDDVEFVDNIYENITEAYKLYPDADIITFQAKTPEGNYFNNYKDKAFKHSLKSTAKVSSIEMTFRIESIHQHKLLFNENFGLGSIYPTGEEFIFLTDALKKGLNLKYYPSVLVIHPAESSGAIFNDEMLIAKGKLIHSVFGYLGYFITFLFAIKKYPFYKKKIKFINALQLMNKTEIN